MSEKKMSTMKLLKTSDQKKDIATKHGINGCAPEFAQGCIDKRKKKK